MFSKMDPYIVVKNCTSLKEYRTKVIDEGGMHPVWDQNLEIQIETMQDVLRI